MHNDTFLRAFLCVFAFFLLVCRKKESRHKEKKKRKNTKKTKGTVSQYLCIAENNEPPNTPATPNMWKGCIKMLCSAWKTIHFVMKA